MKNYNKELDDLFDKWELESEFNGDTKFTRDGLMLKGEILHKENKNDIRISGNENEQWHYAKKKILFLMKDINDTEGGNDVRTWIGRKKFSSFITHMFFKNISLWLFGINSFNESKEFLPFKKAYNPEIYTKAFDSLPFSLVEIKKESGGGTVSNGALWDYVHKGKNGFNLKEQIEILNPNLLVCGGGSGTIFNIVQQIVYPDLKFEKINNWVYYSKKDEIVLIDSYHPTRNSYEGTYNGMMEAYKEYLLKINER